MRFIEARGYFNHIPNATFRNLLNFKNTDDEKSTKLAGLVTLEKWSMTSDVNSRKVVSSI